VIGEAGGSDTRGGGGVARGRARGTRALAENVDAEPKSARAVSFSAERATLARSLFGGRRARGTRPFGVETTAWRVGRNLPSLVVPGLGALSRAPRVLQCARGARRRAVVAALEGTKTRRRRVGRI